jgi:uncharacterized membrane protein
MTVFIYIIETTLSAALLAALAAAFCLRGAPSPAPEKRPVWIVPAGILAGIFCSLVVAVLRRTVAGVNVSVINAWVRTLGIAASLIAALFLWGILKKEKSPDAALFFLINGAALAALFLLAVLPAAFLYPADFLALEENAVNTAFLVKSAFYAAGFLFVFLSALFLYRIARGASEIAFRIIFSAALLANALSSAAVIIQLLYARRIIPINLRVFRIVAFVLNHGTALTFFMAAAALTLSLIVLIKSLGEKQEHRNPAERRKFAAGLIQKRKICAGAIALCAFAVVTLTSLKALAERKIELSPAEPMEIAGNELLIPLEQVSDGHLHRFVWTASEGIEVRFIIIKKNETSFGVGLDACDICGPTGYYERKDGVICMLCDVVMNRNTIGFKGGCNPVPLDWTLRGGSMVIQCASLDSEQGRFR